MPQTMDGGNESRVGENPLQRLDDWDDDVRRRYAKPADAQAAATVSDESDSHQFRSYAVPEAATVREFYRQNHQFRFTQPIGKTNTATS